MSVHDGQQQDSGFAKTIDPAGGGTGALPSRRAIVTGGVKLAFVAPVLSTFFASQAYAANYSCYPLGHTCDTVSEGKRQQCCGALTCKGPDTLPVDPGDVDGTCQP